MFVTSGVYALPIGTGQRFLATSNKVLEGIAGNWNIGGILTLNSGGPFDVLAGSDIANTGGPSQRANRIANVNPYAVQRNYLHWLNPGAFAEPSTYTYGNESRDDLVGPSYKDLDANIFKNFPVSSLATLQFRAEFFNMLNHTNLGNPVNNLQDPAFGEVLSAAGAGREIQFAFKVLW